MNSYLAWGDITHSFANNSTFVFINAFGEFFGMYIFIFLLVGTILNLKLRSSINHAHPFGWIVLGISIGLLCALFASVGIQSGLFHCVNHGAKFDELLGVSSLTLNPAFIIAGVLKGANYQHATSYVPVGNGIVIMLFQALGAFLGAMTCHLFFKHLIDKEEDKRLVAQCFFTTPSVRNIAMNIFNEFFATFILSVAIIGLSVATNNFTLKIVMITVIVAGIGYGVGGVTGYALNPFRDLLPRLTAQLLYSKQFKEYKIDWGYSIVPIVGPILGCMIATVIMPGFLY